MKNEVTDVVAYLWFALYLITGPNKIFLILILIFLIFSFFHFFFYLCESLVCGCLHEHVSNWGEQHEHYLFYFS